METKPILKLNHRLLKAMLLSGSMLASSAMAFAQIEEEDAVQEKVVVVGSAIGVNQSEIESQALPIQLLDAADIATSGQFSVQEILRSEPGFIGSSGEDFETGDGRQTLNLRGLGDEYTLSLLNGLRFSVDGAANVAILPTAAIEQIEVLKTGGSSLYGSDAVSGVVNLVVKNSHDGFGANVTYGDADGNYDFQEYNVFYGADGDRARFFALANYRTNSELAGLERAVTSSNDRRPFGGFDGRSNFQVPGRVLFADGTQLILNTDTVARGEVPDGPEDFRPYVRERDSHDRVQFGANQAYAATDTFTGLISTEYDLTDSTTISSLLLYNRLDQKDNSGASTGLLIVPSTNPYNVFGQDVGVAYRFFHPDFLDSRPLFRDNDSLVGQLSITHQFTDKIEGVISASGYREEFETVQPYHIRPLYERQVALTTEDAFNPFCNRCNSLEQFGGAAAFGPTDSQLSTLGTIDARINAEFDSLLPTGTVFTAFGTNLRQERVQTKFEPLTTAGLVFDFGRNENQDLDRDVAALFAEARVPLMAERSGAGTSPLELGLALRYEDFSDFGTTLDPLVSLRAELIPDTFVLRGAWNTSFRAPTLEQVTDATAVADGLLFDPTVNARVEAIVIEGGNPDLEAEDATSISIGAIWTPPAIDGLFLSLDYWEVNQENIIVAPDAEAILRGEQPGEIQRGDDIGQGGEDLIVSARLANFAERKTSGFDALVRYDFEGPAGIDMSADLAATWVTSFEVDALDGRGLVDGAGEFFPGFGTIPEFKAAGGFAASRGDLSGRLEFSYISSVEDFVNVPNAFDEPNTQDEVLYVDLVGSWTPTLPNGTELTLRAGVENITDELPPFVRANFFPIDQGVYDIRGRYVFASIGVDF